MRRSIVYSSTTTSTTSSASATALDTSQGRQTVPLPHLPLRSLSLIRLFAVISIIGSQFACVLCGPTSIGITTSTAASSVQPNKSNSTENNNLYFDDQNTTKTISSASTAKPTLHASHNHQMPAETTIPSVDSRSNEISYSPSTPIKNLITSPTGLSTTAKTTSATSATAATAAATPKSVWSTNKQPIDSTRTRNHWTTVGGSSTHDTERPRTFRSKHHHEHHWGPFFEEPHNTASSSSSSSSLSSSSSASSALSGGENLVAAVHLFTEAVLNCRVGMLKDKTVMWVRRTTEKVSLLTVGNVTYSGDPRIRVKFQYPNNWRLLINPTHREDAGIYMCQVSTHPPRVFTTNLTILEPPLRIIDEHERDVGDRYYKSGSTVDLQCQISRNFFQKESYNILKSSAINDTMMAYIKTELNNLGNRDQTQQKVSSQEFEKHLDNFITWAKDEEALQALTNKRYTMSDKWLTCRISIPDAKLADSGNYSCSLGRLFTVIVQVQVLTGELPAAVQHNLASRSVINEFLMPWCLFLIIVVSNFHRFLHSKFVNV
ncbi:uncharacterized protein dpr18 [Drosophila tropicalis]|uniref:uncharacterized protein dpr18 n=1 Tax=Drosophila tropicalis TaxID=46794 RepID=UPI0035AB7251